MAEYTPQPFDYAKHLIETDIVRHDPVAAFVLDHVGDRLTEEQLQTGRGLAQVGLGFLLDTATPTVVKTNPEDVYHVLEGGAMLYRSSAGRAFVWLQGHIVVQESHAEGSPVGIDDIDGESSYLRIMASGEWPYDADKQPPTHTATLFSLNQEWGILNRSKQTSQTDINFCTAILRRIKVAYTPPKPSTPKGLG
jgi:hypothetical protein